MKIHPTAIVHKNARLDDGVEVGPYSVIGEHVIVGKGTVIGVCCMIEGRTEIGEECNVFTGAVVGSPPQDLKYKGEESFLKIGNNNIIREYVTINPGTGEGSQTVIGNNILLMAYAHVAHNCVIGNNVIIANVGTLAGHVTIEDRVTIGGLVAVHQFVRIGTLAIIGGCSKVVQDVPPYAMADGHPTKIYGLNTIGLKRAGMSEDVRSHLKRAYKILFQSGLSKTSALEKVKSEVPLVPEVIRLLEFVDSSQRGVCR
jgi:UDP-N-acetylglucosamine acyltransferase